MRTDILAEALIVVGILLLAVAAFLWLGAASGVAVLGVGALACGVAIARGGIGR